MKKLLLALLFFVSGLSFAAPPAGYGASGNPTGSPVGGRTGYLNIVTSGTITVTTKDELLSALATAASGSVVFVPSTASINLTGVLNVPIRPGVTLASDRGALLANGVTSSGGLIYTTTQNTVAMFRVNGINTRITGLRLRGPNIGTVYTSPSQAIKSTYNNTEVDNNELWGWSHAAIFFENGATNGFIHHNYIHHNKADGYGYGICFGNGNANALIEANQFAHNRHSIAATGTPGNSYEARYNIVLGPERSHAFDMHGKLFNGVTTAGDFVHIHHNTFVPYTTETGLGTGKGAMVVVRGKSLQLSQVYNNWFYAPYPDKYGVRHDNVTVNGDNLFVGNNAYGQTTTQVVAGHIE